MEQTRDEKITTMYITGEEEVVTIHFDKHAERGIISVPEVIPSPKPTQTDGKPLTPAGADTADVTEILTNAILATTRDGGSERSIIAVCMLIVSVALLFALMQFKRI